MNLTHDTSHVQEALNRLLEQYKGKPNIQGMLTAFVTQLQLVEDQGWNLLTQRSLSNASGAQLDKLGAIVGIDRQGLDDTSYRQRLYARVQVNVSAGTPEALINVFRLLTSSGTVDLQEWYPGDIALFGDGLITGAQIQFIQVLMELAAPAGTRIAAMGNYDPSNPFSCDGTNAPLGGFGDATDGGVAGGKFASLYVIGSPFAMGGTDSTTGGFSDLNDPVEGGYFSI